MQVEGDATSADVKGMPPAGTVDVVTMSYSLTMIPDWEAALINVRTLTIYHGSQQNGMVLDDVSMTRLVCDRTCHVRSLLALAAASASHTSS